MLTGKPIKKRYGLKDRSKQKLDEIFSKFIRLRAMERVGGCERCLSPKTDYKQLQCSHFHGRSRLSTRWSERNCVGLCGGCHMFLEHHPHEHEAWFKQHLGEREFDLLTLESQQIGKPDINGLYLYYRYNLKE